MLSHCWVVAAHELLLNWKQIVSNTSTYRALYTLLFYGSFMLHWLLHWLLDITAARRLESGHPLMQHNVFLQWSGSPTATGQIYTTPDSQVTTLGICIVS